jgi:hypothetical protein
MRFLAKLGRELRREIVTCCSRVALLDLETDGSGLPSSRFRDKVASNAKSRTLVTLASGVP